MIGLARRQPLAESPAVTVAEQPAPAASLREQGFARLAPDELAAVTGASLPGLEALVRYWSDLPRDQYLRDGGRYRFRRHACFIQELEPRILERTAHRAHWQPTTYNALHGGMERWFEPIEPAVSAAPAWSSLLAGLGSLFAQVRAAPRWYIEAHQFRIDTASGIGRPTPEGAHRDGVDFVAVILVERRSVRGGETRVFPAAGSRGWRFTMREPWSALLLDDTQVVHETTPIQPAARTGWRDTLVVTFRAAGFQAPEGTDAPAG